MQVQDLIVEVRNSAKVRIGQLLPADLVGLVVVARHLNVGTWSITLPSNHRLVDELRTPGAGIVITAHDEVIFSGPTTSAKLEQSKENPVGDWVIEGVDDSVILEEHLAYPLPSVADVTAQTINADVRTGAAETVIKGYVYDNISALAGTVRAIPDLFVETDLGRGSIVTGSARFINLQELLYGLAQTGNIGYRVEQTVNNDLMFQVFEPVDRSKSIRMDIDNGRLTRTEYAYGQPKATRIIVGGPGEAEERLFYEGSNTASLAAETIWARRVERFVDSRGSGLEDELVQSANEALVDEGKTIVNTSVTPSDDQTMRYGIDWNLGDLVTVVVGLTESTAVVTEVGISVQPDGVRIAATVGTPTPTDFESQMISVQQQQIDRISNLERNTTGYGVNTVYQPGGGTNGTQPTFSGPALSGSYNRFGNMVHYNVQVDFTKILTFGTGKYYITLPYPARVRYTFANGHLKDTSSNKTYNLVGETEAGSDQVWLYYIGSNGQMDDFTSTNPVILTTADDFDISGTYEIEH